MIFTAYQKFCNMSSSWQLHWSHSGAQAQLTGQLRRLFGGSSCLLWAAGGGGHGVSQGCTAAWRGASSAPGCESELINYSGVVWEDRIISLLVGDRSWEVVLRFGLVGVETALWADGGVCVLESGSFDVEGKSAAAFY